MSRPTPALSPRTTTWLTFAAGSAIGALFMLIGWMLFAPPGEPDHPEPTPSTPDAASSSQIETQGHETPPATTPDASWAAPRAPLTAGHPSPVSTLSPHTRPTSRPVVEPSQPADAKPSSQDVNPPSLEVVDSALTHRVNARMPIDRLDAFSMDVGQVWAWTRVRNPGASSHITMVWRYQDQVRARVKLEVGTSPGWRTWSRKRIQAHETGLWTVEVRDADDRVLETLRFEVFEEGC